MANRDGAGPEPIFGRISLPEFLAAQVAGVFAGGLALWPGGLKLMPAIGVAIGFGLLLIIPFGRQNLLGWTRIWWRYMRKPNYALGTISDFRETGGNQLGLYWEGSRVCTVIEVLAPRGGLTRVNTEAFDSSHRLPLAELATRLNQHDILLESIDIISHGFRTRAGTPAAAVYEQLIGPLPATAVRTVWLAVSLDTVVCRDAVARRGGGVEGASRSVTIATQRIVRALEDSGCRSRILTAPEIRDAVFQITAGTDPRTIGAGWSHASLGEYTSIGGAIDPNMLGSELLAQLWVPPSSGTTVAVRMEPGVSPATVKLGAAWRLTTRGNPEPPRVPGMISVGGRQRESVLAQLPVGFGDYDKTTPMGEFPISDIGGLVIPPAGCGQLIGADRSGRGIAARVVGAGISRVYIAGELHVTQQIVFRALAVGARILVRTSRPQAWHHLVSAIANHERLTLATDSHQTNAGFNATIVDGVPSPAPHAGVTTIYVTPDPAAWPRETPDLSLHQPGGVGNIVRLATGTARIELNRVAIARETAFIGNPRSIRGMAHA